MGFRFSRRVKLFPGVRLNLGLGGLSMLAGMPGLFTLSSRGARMTFGLPGSGLTYSTGALGAATSRRGPGRASGGLIEDLIRTSTSASPSSAQALVDRTAAARRHGVTFWRNMSAVPGPEDYAAALEVRPFVEAPIRLPTHFRQAEYDLCAQCRREVGSRPVGRVTAAIVAATLLLALIGVVVLTVPTTLLAAFASSTPLTTAVTTAAALLTFTVTMAVAGALVVSILAFLFVTVAAGVADAQDARALFQTRWVERAKAQREADRAAWTEAEHARVERARILLAGDPDTVDDLLTESLGDLDFPFATECDVIMTERTTAALLLDVPPISDVVDATDARVKRDGALRLVKRTKYEQHTEYQVMMAGCALLLAREAIVAAPTVEQVIVCLRTTRRIRGSGELAHHYLFEFTLTRAQLTDMDPATVAPMPMLLGTRGRIDLRGDGEVMAPIDPPSWVEAA